jgi:hypothetical protein
VLIWHADLVHGGHPVSREITRKSVVTHYCPRYLVPLFSEHMAARFHEHDGHLYTSHCYGGIDPLELEPALSAAAWVNSVAAASSEPDPDPVVTEAAPALPDHPALTTDELVATRWFGAVLDG